MLAMSAAPDYTEPGRRPGRIARSTAFFSVATAASRVAGLVREIVAASYYGVYGPMSAFTIAFQVPNLVRALFADAALPARLRRRDPRPHRHPLTDTLSDPDPARGQRGGRPRPQQLRPLRRLRD